MADKLTTWDDLERIRKSENKGFVNRTRDAILMRTVGKTIDQMTPEDLTYITNDGCKDEELIKKIKESIQARK